LLLADAPFDVFVRCVGWLSMLQLRRLFFHSFDRSQVYR
jgi:hypothetical protein